MMARVQVRTISNDEGKKLLRIVRRSSGSIVTWRRAQMVLLSAQGMDAVKIAEVTFTSPDRVRDVLHNFNADGCESLQRKYGGGRPPKFTLPKHQQIKKTALARPTDHGLPFSTWSLPKLADFLVAEWVVDDISHEVLRLLLREEGASFQAVKTWKTRTDPDYEAKKNRVLELCAIADGKAEPGPSDPTVVVCMDEFGPLVLMPHPGKQWAPVATGKGSPSAPRRRTRRATYNRTSQPNQAGLTDIWCGRCATRTRQSQDSPSSGNRLPPENCRSPIRSQPRASSKPRWWRSTGDHALPHSAAAT